MNHSLGEYLFLQPRYSTDTVIPSRHTSILEIQCQAAARHPQSVDTRHACAPVSVGPNCTPVSVPCRLSPTHLSIPCCVDLTHAPLGPMHVSSSPLRPATHALPRVTSRTRC
eukprot:5914272-Prymnesium_polylepis.1